MFNLSSIFVKSPFKPLRDHMEKVTDSVTPLKDFFEVLHQQDFEKAEEFRRVIYKAEEDADKIKNEIRDHLPRSLMMAIDRRDVLELLDMQDKIANTSQDIVELLMLRKMVLPSSLQGNLIHFVETVEQVCMQAKAISKKTDDLMESSFGRHEVDNLLGMIQNVLAAEDKTDMMEDDLCIKLFQEEDNMKPIDVVFWYEIFEWIGHIADYSKKMANRLRLVIAHS